MSMERKARIGNTSPARDESENKPTPPSPIEQLVKELEELADMSESVNEKVCQKVDQIVGSPEVEKMSDELAPLENLNNLIRQAHKSRTRILESLVRIREEIGRI